MWQAHQAHEANEAQVRTGASSRRPGSRRRGPRASHCEASVVTISAPCPLGGLNRKRLLIYAALMAAAQPRYSLPPSPRHSIRSSPATRKATTLFSLLPRCALTSSNYQLAFPARDGLGPARREAREVASIKSCRARGRCLPRDQRTTMGGAGGDGGHVEPDEGLAALSGGEESGGWRGAF